jgi:tRNA G18 (ribose-2'-O)-methylase SpoU
VIAAVTSASIVAMRIEPIDDVDDVRLADYRAAIAGTGGTQGVFLAEGRLVVRKLLAADRFRTRSVLVTPAALSGLRDALATAAEVPVYVASLTVLRSTIGYRFSRGCLAAGEVGATGSLEAILAARPKLLVVLDRVTDPDNVGAVFRSAQAFGAGGALLAPGTGDPLYRKAIRVSMGAALEVPYAEAPAWPVEIARLRAAGFTIVALTPRGDVELGALGSLRPLPERVALVIGGESTGIGAEVLRASDLRVRIEMEPGVDSLNLAAAAAIALHGLRRSP